MLPEFFFGFLRHRIGINQPVEWDDHHCAVDETTKTLGNTDDQLDSS